MHNLEMISQTQQDVSRLYVNATPFHRKDFSPSTLASLRALDLVPGGSTVVFHPGIRRWSPTQAGAVTEAEVPETSTS